MQIVLLSGGSGKRLWPLSNDVRSKQFLRLFPQMDGSYISMAERVYRQIRNAVPAAQVTVATSRLQVSVLRNQLGDQVDICVEPCRRDTFPAIVLVSAYLHDVKHVGLDEAIAVCPVDPYVEGRYFNSVKRLAELAAAGVSDLMLMGIEPTYPSSKYGYILPVDGAEVSRVKSFKEKPNEKKAAEYIEQGALWNSGVFAYRLGYVLDRAHRLLDFQGYEDLYENYCDLRKISFDYAVAEKEQSISVLRYQGEWKDLGTWNTLTEIMEESSIGNVLMAEDCHNVHAINELDIPLFCTGLQDAVVVASPNGIMVSDKTASSHIKPYVENISSQIMLAEKSWGEYRVIDVEENSLTVKVTLNPGHGMSYHSHEHRDEVWTIVEGEGEALLNGEKRPVRTGDIIELPCGMKHSLNAKTRLQVIEVQMGKDISVEDKVKHLAHWDYHDTVINQPPESFGKRIKSGGGGHHTSGMSSN